MGMSNERRLRLMLREIVSAASRRPNADGAIQSRDWDMQVVPTVLIDKAEQLLRQVTTRGGPA